MDDTAEQWRVIPSLGGRYQASSGGRIRSIDHYFSQRLRNGATLVRFKKGRVLRSGQKYGRYLLVPIGQKTKSVAPLVCEAFHGPRPEGLECAHLNGDPADNRPANLQWVTKEENTRHRFEHGTTGMKLTADDVREIARRLLAKDTHTNIARDFNLHWSTVGVIKAGKTWSHITGF